MQIEIDFDKLLNDSVNAAVNATIKTSDMRPESSNHYDQFRLISTISAKITVDILREYHAMLEDSLNNNQATH